MPTNNPTNQLNWNEENLQRTVSDLYREVETDEGLRQRLLADPFEVLSSRIAIPESYRGGILLTEKSRDSMVLYVPAFGAQSSVALPEGTSEASTPKEYQILCTLDPEW